MESTERLVRTWMASGRDEEVDEIVTEITQDRTSLVNVTKALGQYLTAEDVDLVTKGVEFLSLVLSRCPPQKLNRQTARVLTTFYCQKLNDSETIIPALKGLVTLVDLPSFTALDATTVIQALFRHVKMKAHVHSVRFLVYNIIDIVMARYREALKAMGKEFVAGYIYLADGEKDPRNLIVVFAITRVILIEFDISEHVESMFGITFCYFPIAFRPPPNDPYGITTNDLRAALLGCLNAAPNFGPSAIPIFLEKLTTGTRPTKRDTLQAIASCLPVYGAALARVTARKLWNALKLEIFQPTDSDMEEEALKTMQILVHTIYAEEEQALESDEDIQGLARDACEECLQILKEPEKSQAKPATKILCAFITTTPSVSRFIISQAVPHLVKLFHNPDEISNRPPVLILLTDFITACRESTGKDENSGYKTLLLPFKDEVLGVLTIGLKYPPSCVPALLGLQSMVNTKKLVSDEELGFIVLNVNETLQGSFNESDDSSDAVLNLLSEIALLAPRHLEEQTLPLLFSALPDCPPARDAAAERHKYWRVLSVLKALCMQAELFETFIIRLTTKLDLICVPSAGLVETEGGSEPRAAYAHSILKTISQTLQAKVDKAHPDVSKYVDRLVPRLYSLFVYSALVGDDQNMVATDPRLVEAAGEIITLVIQTLTVKRQETFVTALFEAFIKGNTAAIAFGNHKMPRDKVFAPLDSSSSAVQKHSIALFSAGIVPLHKEVQLPVKDVNHFLQVVLTWGLSQAENNLNRDSALHLIAAIVNKRIEDISLFLSHQLESFWSQEIAESKNSIESRQKAIKAWIWMSKALLVRNHSLSLRFANKPFEAFGDTAINWDAAKAIGEIASSDNVLTKQNHAVIKFLYAQKLVNTLLPQIVAGAKDATKPDEQTASLVALTALIRSVPKAVYTHELPSLLPLLLRGLDLPEYNIRSNVIDTFLAAAEGDSPETSIVAEHASTLIAAMLKNSLVANMPSTRVRVVALQYLAILPTIVRYDVLHPHKLTVLRELAKALDDPKRAVRKEAVNARQVLAAHHIRILLICLDLQNKVVQIQRLDK